MDKITKEKITQYYTTYYRDQCSLSDWKTRVTSRINEDGLEEKRMAMLCRDFNFQMDEKKHLIIGAGTGGLAIVLKQAYSADVFGVEPDSNEFEIITLRCKEYGINPNNFHKSFGESLPFKDSEFDFIHCFTVLEHVQDIDKCIDEMIRTVKPSGRIIINTPNYKYPYEGHYKIYFPTFLPKFLGCLYLKILGKKCKFLSTINFITELDLNRILVKKIGIKWFRVYSSQNKLKGLQGIILNYLLFRKFIYPQQNIIILKNN